MKRVALLGLACVATLTAVQPGGAKTAGVLAIVGTGSSARLGYVDPASLQLVGRSTQVGYYSWPAARSPDGSQLALARNNPGGIRIVDLRRMRTVRAFKEPDGVSALAWVAPRRILVLSEGLPVLAVDPVSGRRLWWHDLATFPEAVARSAGGFVLLSPPDDYEDVIGPSTLTTVSPGGVVRSVVLDRIVTGNHVPGSDNPEGSQRIAGLAVDAAGNRAFVVGAGEPIAEVDLGTLAVSYHGGTRTITKLLDGPFRSATWLPNGTIAVTGYDGHVGRDSGETETPAGLTIVDPATWTSRAVDADATSVALIDDMLVSYSWFADTGLSLYGLDGTPRGRALSGWTVQYLQTGGGTAFATASDGNGEQLAVVDLASGRVLGIRPSSLANVLLVAG